MKPVSLLVAAMLSLTVSGCSASPATEPPVAAATGAAPHSGAPTVLEPSEPWGLLTLTLVSPDGAPAVEVPAYDAFESATRSRGLMGRTSLPAGAGMVFRYPSDRDGGFWMKDTLIPLSIAYFDGEGTVVSVLDMEPCLQDPCRSYRPGVAYRGALEVNQGFFARIGLTPGWRVELPPGIPAASS